MAQVAETDYLHSAIRSLIISSLIVVAEIATSPFEKKPDGIASEIPQAVGE